MCDFSHGGVLLCVREWSLVAEKVCIKLIPFFSGHSFKFIAFLSPVNADGAVKFYYSERTLANLDTSTVSN